MTRGGRRRSLVLPPELETRLVSAAEVVGGRAGRVEVRRAGDRQWATVCDDGFGVEEARVVCRSLGFPASAPLPNWSPVCKEWDVIERVQPS